MRRDCGGIRTWRNRRRFDGRRRRGRVKAGESASAAGGGPAFEEFADHLGVAGALRRQMGEAKLILNVADGGFGGAFDFEEGAEVGEGVEFDEAVGEARRSRGPFRKGRVAGIRGPAGGGGFDRAE